MARDRTISEFGEQWSRFGDTGEDFASAEVLADLCGPLLPLGEIAGLRVVEIGSGNGRIVRALLAAGAAHVTAVEPSAGIEMLRQNLGDASERVDTVQATGEELPSVDAQLAVCIGVLHHIRDPLPTVRRIREVLPEGGRFLMWVYGREGSGGYIALVESLRLLTRIVPDFVLSGLAHVLNALLSLYVGLAGWLPVPLGRYMREVMSRYDRRQRTFLIFDQLNCGYARYYRGEEVRELLERGGFTGIRLYHRHGMSWTAIGEKPAGAATC